MWHDPLTLFVEYPVQFYSLTIPTGGGHGPRPQRDGRAGAASPKKSAWRLGLASLVTLTL